MTEGVYAASGELEDKGEASVRRVSALLVTEDGCELRTEVVAVEMRADISFTGEYWASVALSPGDLEDYAYGAAFAAGFIGCAEDVSQVEVDVKGGVAEINLQVSTSGVVAPSRPGGNYDDFDDEVPLEPAAIWRMSRSLLPAQGMHLATGATHAAVFANGAGVPVLMREDVGRHISVDKLIGAMLRARVNPQAGFAYLSSRCALELVSKLSRAGVRIVATVSAPTTAVLDFAEREDVTLCAFARDGRFTVYTHPERIMMK